MSFTFVTAGGFGTSASGTSLPVTIGGVSIGDLIVIGTKWEDQDDTVTISDGASTFVETTAAHPTNGNPAWGTLHYCLASAASGSVTYTATFSPTASFKEIGVMIYTPTSLPSLDGTPSSQGGFGATTVTSGNITTLGTDGLMFGWYGEVGSAITSPLINGLAADRSQSVGSSSRSMIWAKAYTSGFTGAATGSVLAANYVVDGIAFKITTGAASDQLDWQRRGDLQNILRNYDYQIINT